MKDRSQPAWLIPTLLIGSGCLILLCLVGAVIFGAALLGETLPPQLFAALALILGGLLLSRSRRPRVA